MVSSLRISLSALRIGMVLWCISDNLMYFTGEFVFRLGVFLILLLFFGTLFCAVLENVDFTFGLKVGPVDFACFCTVSLLHVIFCIKLQNSQIISEFIRVNTHNLIYILQLLVHLYQTFFPFFIFYNELFTNFKVTGALILCMLEFLVTLCLILKKTNKSYKSQTHPRH